MIYLESVAIACPSKHLANCITFYSALGMIQNEHLNDPTSTTTTKLYATGYEYDESDHHVQFYLELVETPDFVQPLRAPDVLFDGPDKLVFYSKDLTQLLEQLASLECNFLLTMDPINAGGNTVCSCLGPAGTEIALIQLQSDRHYCSDNHAIPIDVFQWEVKLGYVQLVCEHPIQTAKYLAGMFKGLKVVDEEQYQSTHFLWVSNVERDMNVSICFKHTANKSSPVTKVDQDEEDECIKSGEILAIGLSSSKLSLNQLIPELGRLSKMLPAMLHLGNLFFFQEVDTTTSSKILKKVIPKVACFELSLGAAHVPLVSIAVTGATRTGSTGSGTGGSGSTEQKRNLLTNETKK